MMLKYFLSILVSVTLSIGLRAQDAAIKKFRFGIEAGPNLTEIYGDRYRPLHTVPAVAFSCGFNFQAALIKHLSFKTGLSFERKVEKIQEDVNYSDETMQATVSGRGHSNFDYLTLPLLIQFDAGHPVNFFANLGPYFGVMVHGKGIVETPDNSTYTFTPNTNKFDMGISFGLGLAVEIKQSFTLTFEARNNLSLLPLYSKYKELKTNSTVLLFGFMFGTP